MIEPTTVKDLANNLTAGFLLLAAVIYGATAFMRQWVVPGSYLKDAEDDADKRYTELNAGWQSRFDEMKAELTKQIVYWQNETVSSKQAELTTKTENSVLLREMSKTLADLLQHVASLRRTSYSEEQQYGPRQYPAHDPAVGRNPAAPRRLPSSLSSSEEEGS